MDAAKKRKMDDNGLASPDASDPNLALTRDKSRRMLESFYRGEHHSPSFNTVGCTEQPEPLVATSAPGFNGHRYSSPWRYSYDVFLSFRGEDTRHTFSGHLRHALRRTGVNLFFDDDGLRKGDKISPALERAIKESRISIVVLSENYADSAWCLNELAKIIECHLLDKKKQVIEPVFYHAFEKQECRFSENVELVMKWREAMKSVANLSGWTLKKNECESTLIQSVVKDVLRKLNRKSLHVADFPVHLQPHVDMINSKLAWIRAVGLRGIGGVGKTTVAKAVYNCIADQFEGSCFLANVRENSQHGGLAGLQEALLHQTLRDINLKIDNVDQGVCTIRDRLSQKKVLVIVDDVDHLDQLRKLVGGPNWFGPGSRIIVTTRDEHLLVAHDVDWIHTIDCLRNQDAFRLFCWNAFRGIHPEIGYEDLSYMLINYAKGLPLALIVLGSFLRGRSISEWKSTLDKLKKIPHEEIHDVLKISFDGLEEQEKAIFLDIACFLRGKSTDYIKEFLDACEFNSVIGIQILKERSLVTIEHGVMHMHDLLQQMGWEIVRQESIREPGQRSRLWSKDDVLYVLSNSLGTNAVEGIVMDLPEPEEVHLGDNAFANMTSLRLLVIRGAQFSGAPLCLPSGLRWIELPGCSFSSLEFKFGLKKLREVNLRGSSFKWLGAGFQNFKHLRSIKFADCGQLIEIPDFSTIKNLETLILSGCSALTEVHESVGFLPKLVTLDLHSCSNLGSFPSVIKLKSLETFVLSGCAKLKSFPHVGEYMTCLYDLRLEKSGVEELPSSLEHLVNLNAIFLDGCKNLTCLPPCIYNLHYLRLLYLSNCSKLGKFPELVEDLDSICLPCCCSSSRSANFMELVLRNCNLRDVDNLLAPQSFTKLRGLDLSENPFVSLPASIVRLLYLDWLCLEHCALLQEISQLPPNIKHLYVRGCKSLRKFLRLSRVSVSGMKQLPLLELVDFSNCLNMTYFADGPSAEDLRTTSVTINFPGSEIPEWFSYRSLEGTICFQVPWDRFLHCNSFAFCVVFGLEESLTQECGMTGGTIDYNYSITVDGECIMNDRYDMQSIDSDHLWLFYGSPACRPIVKHRLHGSVCLMFSVVVNRAPSIVVLKSCGVHLA
ncbi:TMV resistance protein N-like [Eucalyptus grandis]|uniref:TMV resistance protein N-like n=1 Tax=Eucalyptus grandis TaxID=71139 RepID=UPI00192E7689|nr:TMV resistance protein N-like [Eucalyptus grandis]